MKGRMVGAERNKVAVRILVGLRGVSDRNRESHFLFDKEQVGWLHVSDVADFPEVDGWLWGRGCGSGHVGMR